MNDNGGLGFNAVVLYFNNREWIPAHESVAGFDYNGNKEIDFNALSYLSSKGTGPRIHRCFQ